MSIEMVAPLIASEGEWTTNEKMVLIILADNYNGFGEFVAMPPVGRIARRASIGRSTAHRVLRSLEDKGAIRTAARYRDDGGQDSNFYKIMLGA